MQNEDPRSTIVAMCHNFYTQGWVSGTGGGMSVRHGDRVYMMPSGVEKEKIRPEDIFVLDLEGKVLEPPTNPDLKLTECASLFFSAYRMRAAGAVMHSHSANLVLATMLAERRDGFLSELEFTEFEMIKGLEGHRLYDVFRLPVIDNAAHEYDLTEQLQEAIRRYPHTCAVAVRNHGVYVWGPTASKTKTHAECIHYLCELMLRMRELGIREHRREA